jgi:hypothetical protein
MGDQQTLEPAALLQHTLERCLELSCSAMAAEAMDQHRAAAFTEACGLARASLQAVTTIAATQQQGTIKALAELAGIAGTLTQRLGLLEQQQQEEPHGDA